MYKIINKVLDPMDRRPSSNRGQDQPLPQSKNKSSSSASPKAYSMNVKPSDTCYWETHPRKRALLCGVSYRKKKYELKGSINDVKSMRDWLMCQFAYPVECIRVLKGNYKLVIFFLFFVKSNSHR